MQKRFIDIYDKTINYMIELKSQNLASKDIWDSFQPYHGKKMSMLFGKLIYLWLLSYSFYSEVTITLRQKWLDLKFTLLDF